MKKAILVLVMVLVSSISVLAGGLVYTGQPGDDLWTLSEVNRLIAVDKNFGYTAKTWQELMLINPQPSFERNQDHQWKAVCHFRHRHQN